MYHPEMIEDNPEDRPEGLEKMDCFIDATRLCNASCMAYVTYPLGGPKELSQMQSHCALLLFGERISRHVTIIASTLAATSKRQKTADQDRQRTAATPVADASPGPFANPFPAHPAKAKP
jgi:hypothetical protein